MPVAAPRGTVLRIAADLEGWAQHHPPTVHVEPGPGDEVLGWSLVNDHAVRCWRARRRVDQDAGRLEWDPPGFELTVTPGQGRSCFVRLRGSDPGDVLDSLKAAAERDQELTISFEDPLFVAGRVEDVYEYLRDAARWPERIPHVTRLELAEPGEGVQFFDMDTVTPDGAAHTTRSVRICLPYRKIVYKQTRRAPLLSAHTGSWTLHARPEGVTAVARHTATIDPAMLSPGVSVQDARSYLRRALGANSMKTLRCAKAYAEERAHG